MRQRDADGALQGPPFRPENNSPFFRHYFTRASLLCLIGIILFQLTGKGNKKIPLFLCSAPSPLLHTLNGKEVLP